MMSLARFLIGIVIAWVIVLIYIFHEQLYSKTRMEMNLYHVITTEPISNIMIFDNTINALDCASLNPKILLYNRIFKTGSTSTSVWLDSFSSARKFSVDFSTTEDFYNTGISYPYPEIIASHARRHLSNPNVTRFVFIAHFYFRNFLNLSSTHTYINQVREPVKRVISNYFYIHRDKSRPRRRMKELQLSGYKNESFEDCLRRQHNGCQGNVMTRFFCGKHSYCKNGDERALRKAKNNIRRYYAAVGLLEHLVIYLQILQKRFPTFIPANATSWVFNEKVNPSYVMSEVSMATIRHIKQLNWADLKLYEFIKQRFWRQAKACRIIY